MPAPIPTYRLREFARPAEVDAGVFCPPARWEGAQPALPISLPYRSDYYKISLCTHGTAELEVNLQSYAVTPGCLVMVTPHTIKQWPRIADDYEAPSVFFTADFVAAHAAPTGRLGFLLGPVAAVLPLAAAEPARIASSLHFLQQKYHAPHANRRDIVQTVITGLLYEVAALYDQAQVVPAAATRGQALATAFRQLVRQHSSHARSVAFYADQLCVTAKHLTEMVRGATGHPASDLIAEAVALEAKALLQSTALPMQQIADQLHFADQAAFSRFFKKATGLSPTAYRHA